MRFAFCVMSLLVGPTLETPLDWEASHVWHDVDHHGVVNILLTNGEGEPLALGGQDRVFAYPLERCGEGDPIGTSFAPREAKMSNDTTFSYFEVHVGSASSRLELCFELHRGSLPPRVRVLDDLDGESFVFEAESRDFGTSGSGFGIPTLEGLRRMRTDETLTPSPSPPPSLCVTCVSSANRVANPFCGSGSASCEVGALEGTIRLFRYVLFGEAAYPMSAEASALTNTCISPLSFPDDRFTPNDVIEYARHSLLGTVPAAYAC